MPKRKSIIEETKNELRFCPLNRGSCVGLECMFFRPYSKTGIKAGPTDDPNIRYQIYSCVFIHDWLGDFHNHLEDSEGLSSHKVMRVINTEMKNSYIANTYPDSGRVVVDSKTEILFE